MGETAHYTHANPPIKRYSDDAPAPVARPIRRAPREVRIGIRLTQLRDSVGRISRRRNPTSSTPSACFMSDYAALIRPAGLRVYRVPYRPTATVWSNPLILRKFLRYPITDAEVRRGRGSGGNTGRREPGRRSRYAGPWLAGGAAEQLRVRSRRRGMAFRTRRNGRTPQVGPQFAVATAVPAVRSSVASNGSALDRKSSMYPSASGAACGSLTRSGSRWTPRTRNS